MAKKVKQKPFRRKFQLCGTVAESWHYAAKAPKWAVKGMASHEYSKMDVCYG